MHPTEWTEWDNIYAAGRQDWLRYLEDVSPIIAHRVRQDQLTLAQGISLIGVKVGGFGQADVHRRKCHD